MLIVGLSTTYCYLLYQERVFKLSGASSTPSANQQTMPFDFVGGCLFAWAIDSVSYREIPKEYAEVTGKLNAAATISRAHCKWPPISLDIKRHNCECDLPPIYMGFRHICYSTCVNWHIYRGETVNTTQTICIDELIESSVTKNQFRLPLLLHISLPCYNFFLRTVG